VRKNAKKFVEVVCAACGSLVVKESKEHTRQIKQGNNRFFCDLKCSGKNLSSLRIDEFSPFRRFYTSSRKIARTKKRPFNLSLSYLKDLWEAQQGKCPYMQVSMDLPANTNQVTCSPAAASLDRIDSCKGYIKGNVEFVCLFVNLGKNGFSKEQIQDLFRESNRL
jgi:hypothetical protein